MARSDEELHGVSEHLLYELETLADLVRELPPRAGPSD